MTAGGALAKVGGAKLGERRGLDTTRVRNAPPWRAWKTRARHARCIRWIETYCRIPSGANAGELLRLAPFQRHAIEELLAPGVRDGGLQIPRGNAKSTLWAAVGLWAVCDSPDAPQVPLIANTLGHARRNLLRRAAIMVRTNPELSERVVVYTGNDGRIWSAWNEGDLLPLPSDVDRLQGLDPTVALIDEAQTIGPEIVAAVAQGAGKRADSLVLTIGTPAPGAVDSALFDRRRRAAESARIVWVEYAAPDGCALDDRRAWRTANPALAAGILFADALENELVTVDETSFRSYRLGQWIEIAVASWLPPGAWADCPSVVEPPDGSEIVLALAGTWRGGVALIGSSLDGEVFVAWYADTADDVEIWDVIERARSRWRLVEIVVAPRIRPRLVYDLGDEGFPVQVWPATREVEVASSTDFRRAIVEGRVPHDHDPMLAGQIGATVGRSNADGTLVLVAPDDETNVSAAKAARMAWSRARDHSAVSAPAIW